MPPPILQIRDLHVNAEDRPILKGLDLTLCLGQTHALMGPNGSGKSTLAAVLAGRKDLQVTRGSVCFDGRDLLALKPEERAREGLFLAFQYPVAIPGVNAAYFLRTALNETRRHHGLDEIDAMDFLENLQKHARALDIPKDLLNRSVNEDFSGGEKKRHEILQMSLLEPRLAVLDETDSGLDIDALKSVAAAVQAMRAPNRSQLIITHYPRLLEHLKPDAVHVLVDGRIVRSGGASLAQELEKRGYDWLLPEDSNPAMTAAP